MSSYKRRLAERFGARLHNVALFGSWARAQQHTDSDVDVLVLIDNATANDVTEAAMMIADVDLETEVWLSPKIYSSERFEQIYDSESPFARAVSRDSVPV
ncbi:MAG: nucleotidyltransferase domain-containing protein [Myxococcaceae bacterium]